MEELDLVVVGGGLSGLTAAYYAAKAGLSVLVLERGDVAGSKNLSGGRIYLGPLRGLMDDLLEGMCTERKVVVERLSAVVKEGSATLSFRHSGLELPSCESHTVLRAKLDSHLAQRVAEVGGFVVPQKRVDSLIKEGDRVVGILSDGEEIRARGVILAEGVLGLLSKELGLYSPPRPSEVATAIKEVIRLPERAVESRFGVGPGEGVAHLFVGAVTHGVAGGGFLYTNQDTVSLGLVFKMDALLEVEARPHELLESFKAREEIAPLIAGGETVEFGAHMIPEARRIPLGNLAGNGYLVVGDAAGLSLNMGATVRGMDMAMASGFFAARAMIQGQQRRDFSASCLGCYVQLLKESFVCRDMETFRAVEGFLASPRLYKEYPEFLCEALVRIFQVGPGPKESYSRSLRRAWGKAPAAVSVLRDLWRMRGF